MCGATVITSAGKRNDEARRIAGNMTPDGRFQPKRECGHRTGSEHGHRPFQNQNLKPRAPLQVNRGFFFGRPNSRPACSAPLSGPRVAWNPPSSILTINGTRRG